MISIEQLCGTIVAVVTIIGGLVYWAFTHLEQIEILLSWIYKLISWGSRSLKLKAISTQIQSKINTLSSGIETEVQNVMPHPLKIVWIRGDNETATLSEGQVIVRMRHELDDSRNLITAIMLYLQVGFLRDSRPFIDNAVQKALDLLIAWRLLNKSQESNETHYFLTNIYNPIIHLDSKVEEYSRKLGVLDDAGILTRIYIRELRSLGMKTKGFLPEPYVREETCKFADFLHVIQVSERGGVYPLNFVGKTIKAGIQLVARMDTVAHSGLRIHKKWLQSKIQMGEETIYIRAMGNENINLARHLAQWAQKEGMIEIVRSQTFVVPTRYGNPQRAVVIICHSSQIKSEVILDPKEEVQAILVRHIPPIALDQVEILDIVREPRIQCKVLIRSIKTDCDPVQLCLGSNKQYLQAASTELQESIWFVSWSENREEFLLNCLGINHNKLHSIHIDTQQRIAEIIVTDSESAAKAIGIKGTNVKLAEKITGLRIDVYQLSPDGEKTKSKLSITPEEELLTIIKNHIPEIASGAIRVVDVARDVGIQAKVVIQNVSSLVDPLKICIGDDQRIVLGIKDELGEAVWFVKWDENPDKYLANCLGIRWHEQVNVTIDDALHTALVEVKNDTIAGRAIGENGINVKQTRQLTRLRKIRIISANK